MDTCHNCGRTLKANAKFCIYCGARKQITPRKTPNRKTAKRRQGSRSSNANVEMPALVQQRGKEKPSKMNIQTRQHISTNKRIDRAAVNEIDPLIIFEQRVKPRLATINRLLMSFDTRDEFSRSDATQLHHYIDELKQYLNSDEMKESKYKNETTKTLEKTNMTALSVYGSLTHLINDDKLKSLRNKWDEFHVMLDTQVKKNNLLDNLELQNKIINTRINTLEELLGNPNRANVSKSKLLTSIPSIKVYYLNSLQDPINQYLMLIQETEFSDMFEREVRILNTIKKWVDPNISMRETITTRAISKLCFDFLEERGLNAAKLRMQLAELEKDLELHQDEIKLVQRDYMKLMWGFINEEQLAIHSVTPGSQSIDRSNDKKRKFSSSRTSTKGTENTSLQSLVPLDELDQLNELKKLI